MILISATGLMRLRIHSVYLTRLSSMFQVDAPRYCNLLMSPGMFHLRTCIGSSMTIGWHKKQANDMYWKSVCFSKSTHGEMGTCSMGDNLCWNDSQAICGLQYHHQPSQHHSLSEGLWISKCCMKYKKCTWRNTFTKCGRGNEQSVSDDLFSD